ncbi:glycerol-3-phosphate cytidylyltransferase [Cytobacillus firmus]|uniref:glycerol-3-phosphate cytidylyltransferase n=1 Tax=Cytobacillus firmus TaxID=1399 RepID=UPI00218A0516|nr:glycerol-3-phosphate cytidylyltransferase [Cytobacillus firmus]URM33468.1 glycerol-3-phosphate cytidylyltransferase [Cytobacillus firmus]
MLKVRDILSLSKSSGEMSTKKVLTYGTFDLLRIGHINLLKRAKELGDYLVVGLSTDAFNNEKNKVSYHSYENRKIMDESIKYVDEVIPEQEWSQKINDVVEHNIDLFVMGDDWEGRFNFLEEYCNVIYLPRTVGISTSKIKIELQQVKEQRR